MKRKLFTALLVLCVLSGFSQTWNSITNETPSPFKTTLMSTTETTITVNVQVPGFFATSVTTPRGLADIISLPKAVSTASAGEPNLPMLAIPALIDDQAQYQVRVVQSRYQDYSLEVAPSKGDFSRQINPEDVPYTYSELYSEDTFYPDTRVGLYEPYILRDFRGQNIVVQPFAYNPVRKTLRVYYDLTVEMYTDGAKGTNTLNRKSNEVKLDPNFKAIYESHFINYKAASSRYNPINESGRLLIICHDAFMGAMEPYVNWKKQIGIPTTMVGTSVSGANSEALKNYIQQQYNNDNSIAHILLVGDNPQIQGYYAYNGGYSGRSDNWYGQVAGNDYYNDVLVGRFSAENTDHVTTQVNKVLTYERDLDATATWLTYGTGVATYAGNGGHFGEDDWQHIDNIKTDLLGYHYEEVYRDYQNAGGANSSATQLSQHINNGLSIINYCNHGSETSWGVFGYSNSNVNALTNVNKFPIVWSVACLNGKYDHYQPCFAETWLRANNNNNVNQPTGAIGGMFSYIEQPWVPPMYGQDEMVDILVESHSNNIKRTLGGISFDGNMKIIDQYGSNNSAAMGTYMCWILYGDPTLTLRNAIPTDMGLSHSPVIPIGSTTFVVNADNGDGARATLTIDNEILGSAVIDNGTATIEFETPTQPGQATLTVFGYNKITYIATVNIVTSGDDEPIVLTVTANPSIIARGGTSTLNAQATGGNWFYTYDWSPSTSLNQSNIKSPIANPQETTTYTCTVTSGSFTETDSCTVIVVCPPTNLTATVEGNQVQIQWDVAIPADSYKVFRNGTLVGQGITGLSFTDNGLSPGNYSYRVTTVYQGVESPKSGYVVATITAPLSVTASCNPAVIPAGGNTTLTANVTGGNSPSYAWEPAESVSNPSGASTLASPTETTTYTVTVSSDDDTATAQTTVEVVTSPSEVTVELVTDVDDVVELQWQEATLASYYRIYRNNALIADNIAETHYTTEALANGTHCFTVTAVYQNVESPASEEACIEINACYPPENFEGSYYWENGEYGSLLMWNKNQNVNMSLVRFNIYRYTNPDHIELIASQVNVPFNYHYEFRDENVLPGTYYYLIGANYGEGNECYTEALWINITSLDEKEQTLTVYPNPTQGAITIAAAENAELRIVNSLGQTLVDTVLEEKCMNVDLTPYGKGLYLIILRSEQGVSTKKVIVE